MRAAIRERLAPRQRELAELVADGLNNPEAAERMGLTEGGCKSLLSTIYTRWNLQGWGNSRARLVQILNEERAQCSTNGYAFPVGV